MLRLARRTSQDATAHRERTIDAIVRCNPTATRPFLARFEDATLAQYLQRLEGVVVDAVQNIEAAPFAAAA